jgi:hypothetical protein
VTDLADDLLKAAQATGDEQLTGDAWSLASDAAEARGDLAAAAEAVAQCRVIFERLAAADPDETGWQLRVAFAQLRIGDLALLRNDLEAAAPAIAEYLEISERLAALDPANTVWRQDLE